MGDPVPVSPCFLAVQLDPGAVVPGRRENADVLVGTPGDDIIAGGSGNDRPRSAAAATT